MNENKENITQFENLCVTDRLVAIDIFQPTTHSTHGKKAEFVSRDSWFTI